MEKRRPILHRAQKKRTRRRILLAAGMLVLTAWVVLFPVNQSLLTIELNGSSELSLEYGDSYEEQGACVVVKGRYFWKDGLALPKISVERSSALREDILGRYTVAYAASVLGQDIHAERTVSVIDTVCPVITFHTNPLTVDGKPSKYSFSATDNYDGDITHRVKCSKTTGWMTYSVMDSSGNPTYVIREISEYAAQPPEIILAGEEAMSIPVGTFYVEPGFEALDVFDGDLTPQVMVEGQVDWLTPGEYPITYSVTDSYGNEVAVTRNVTVEARPRPQTVWPAERTIYLTFDDGPGPYTMQLLNVLEKYKVKATFFVVNSDYNNIMKEIVIRGHTIGVHSVSHDYAEIYANPEAYFADIFQMQDIIYENTGVYTTLMRFPGGSSNLVSMDSNKGIMTVLTEAVQDAGFQYFDWNVDSDDAGEADQAGTVFQNVTDGIMEQGISVVLLHDIHGYTVDAVEDIIQWGLANGYTFRALRDNSPGFHHDIRN